MWSASSAGTEKVIPHVPGSVPVSDGGSGIAGTRWRCSPTSTTSSAGPRHSGRRRRQRPVTRTVTPPDDWGTRSMPSMPTAEGTPWMSLTPATVGNSADGPGAATHRGARGADAGRAARARRPAPGGFRARAAERPPGSGGPPQGEHPRELRDHHLGLVADLAPGESQHDEPRRLKREVPAVVALERAPRAVERVAVDLHDDALLPPQEVKLELPVADVDLGRRQAGAAHQREHPLLGLGTGHRGCAVLEGQLAEPRHPWAPGVARRDVARVRPSHQPAHKRLVEQRLEPAVAQRRRQIEERPRRARERQPAVAPDLAPIEVGGPVYAKALARAGGIPAQDRQLDLIRRRGDRELPEGGGRGVAEDGPPAEGEDGGLLARELGEGRRRHHPVYAAVKRVKQTGARRPPDGGAAQPDRVQLLPGDHAALAGGQLVHGAMGPASGNNLPTVAPCGTVGRKGSLSALILPTAVRR